MMKADDEINAELDAMSPAERAENMAKLMVRCGVLHRDSELPLTYEEALLVTEKICV